MEQQLTGEETGWWICCQRDRLWLPQGELPQGAAAQWQLQGETAWRIGEWQGMPVWLLCRDMGNGMVPLRNLLAQERGLFQLAGRGVQLAEFLRSHRYCGYCAEPMQLSRTEWACLCSACRERYYPQVAPCVIVAIRRDDQILLAQHQRHRGGIHTVLAGFVEVGETLEQAVEREVMEESGIRIRNLRYVTSQPWPFPHSLMMAFMADYDRGELQIDEKELIHANWYRYDALPLLPPVGTVARRLIEDTVALCRQAGEG